LLTNYKRLTPSIGLRKFPDKRLPMALVAALLGDLGFPAITEKHGSSWRAPVVLPGRFT